jgi:hypothetical protein
MHRTINRRFAHLGQAAAPAVIATLAIAILLRFPPALYGFYPRCPLHQYLHIICPGCGATRALATLLRGNLAEAFRLNALITLLAPVALFYAAACYRSILARRPLSLSQPPPSAVYATLAIAAVFTVARNL